MKKKVPRYKTCEAAERFLEQDLTDYLDQKNFTPATFELLPKTRQVNLRFSEPLLYAVRQQKAQEGISCQNFILRAVEGSLKRNPLKPMKNAGPIKSEYRRPHSLVLGEA